MAASPPGFLLRFIGGVIWNAIFPATKSMGFNIALDQRAKGELGRERPLCLDERRGRVKFLQFVEMPLPSCPLIFADRIEGCNEDDVGNYECLSYTPSDYATPSLIRKSIAGPPYRKEEGKCRQAVNIHSRTGLARELNLPGAQSQHGFSTVYPSLYFRRHGHFQTKGWGIACCIAWKTGTDR